MIGGIEEELAIRGPGRAELVARLAGEATANPGLHILDPQLHGAAVAFLHRQHGPTPVGGRRQGDQVIGLAQRAQEFALRIPLLQDGRRLVFLNVEGEMGAGGAEAGKGGSTADGNSLSHRHGRPTDGHLVGIKGVGLNDLVLLQQQITGLRLGLAVGGQQKTRLTGVQRTQHDGPRFIRDIGAGEVDEVPPVRQEAWMTMGIFPGRVQSGERFRFAAFLADAMDGAAESRGKDDDPVGRPRATLAVGRLTDGHRGPSVTPHLFQDPGLDAEETHPLGVRRPERVLSIECARQHAGLTGMQVADVEVRLLAFQVFGPENDPAAVR